MFLLRVEPTRLLALARGDELELRETAVEVADYGEELAGILDEDKKVRAELGHAGAPCGPISNTQRVVLNIFESFDTS